MSNHNAWHKSFKDDIHRTPDDITVHELLTGKKAESKPKAKKPTKHTKAKVEEPIKRPEGYILGEHGIDFSGLELKLTLPLSARRDPCSQEYREDYQNQWQRIRQQIINNAEYLAEKYKFDVYVLAFLDIPLVEAITLDKKEVLAPCVRTHTCGPIDHVGVYGHDYTSESLRGQTYEGTIKTEVVQSVSADKLTFAIASFYTRAENKTPIKKKGVDK